MDSLVFFFGDIKLLCVFDGFYDLSSLVWDCNLNLTVKWLMTFSVKFRQICHSHCTVHTLISIYLLWWHPKLWGWAYVWYTIILLPPINYQKYCHNKMSHLYVHIEGSVGYHFCHQTKGNLKILFCNELVNPNAK